MLAHACIRRRKREIYSRGTWIDLISIPAKFSFLGDETHGFLFLDGCSFCYNF